LNKEDVSLLREHRHDKGLKISSPEELLALVEKLKAEQSNQAVSAEIPSAYELSANESNLSREEARREMPVRYKRLHTTRTKVKPFQRIREPNLMSRQIPFSGEHLCRFGQRHCGSLVL
jgi:hypothetical protein